MKFVYCANCGKRLNIKRKGLKKYAAIIDIVEYHECGEMVEFDLKPVDIPTFTEVEGKNKFVKKLNKLQPSPNIGSISTGTLKDRRFESEEKQEKKSSAPDSVQQMLKTMMNSEPAHELKESE
jgi:hypothetical protein